MTRSKVSRKRSVDGKREAVDANFPIKRRFISFMQSKALANEKSRKRSVNDGNPKQMEGSEPESASMTAALSVKVKVWEGQLCALVHNEHKFVSRLEGFMNAGDEVYVVPTIVLYDYLVSVAIRNSDALRLVEKAKRWSF